MLHFQSKIQKLKAFDLSSSPEYFWGSNSILVYYISVLFSQSREFQSFNFFFCLTVGSSPQSRPCFNRPYRKSQRSTNGYLWRTRSCCGNYTTETSAALDVSRPPLPFPCPKTPPPSPQPPYHPDNLWTQRYLWTFWPFYSYNRTCTLCKDL